MPKGAPMCRFNKLFWAGHYSSSAKRAQVRKHKEGLTKCMLTTSNVSLHLSKAKSSGRLSVFQPSCGTKPALCCHLYPRQKALSSWCGRWGIPSQWPLLLKATIDVHLGYTDQVSVVAVAFYEASDSRLVYEHVEITLHKLFFFLYEDTLEQLKRWRSQLLSGLSWQQDYHQRSHFPLISMAALQVKQ